MNREVHVRFCEGWGCDAPAYSPPRGDVRELVYVALVTDVFARRIVGWRVSSSLATDFVPDAPEQVINERGGATTSGLVHQDGGDSTQRPMAPSRGR